MFLYSYYLIIGSKSLLKWKGVTFSPDDEEKKTPGADSNSCGATIGTNPTPGTDRDMDFNGFTTDAEGHKVIFMIFLSIISFVFHLIYFGCL